ncbi:hypothetical protein JKF63_04395 [Porcisia hertigi]|uniref:Uncharacterized protein n=1 Tax=Porcisia hertigi TaxID=2761500 RepID=A0A836INP2_9TRYP|nr:hypothetical protein JKF63_04395 [Porcisia hertigi]
MSRPNATRLALLGLLALLVPIAVVFFVMWCISRRTRYKRTVKDLRLNGTRRPGEVDDVDMGAAIKGGDWLSADAAAPNTARFGAHRTPFAISTASMAGDDHTDATFDPIGQQAAEAQQRRLARRVAVAAAEAAGNGDSGRLASSLRDKSTVAESDVWVSDEEEGTNYSPVSGGVSGGGITGAGGPAPIYAASFVSPTTGVAVAGALSGASVSPSASGAASPGTSAALPVVHNSQYFNETARVLLGCYTAENEGGGPQAPLSASGGRGVADAHHLPTTAGGDGGGNKAVVKKSNSAFEQILSSAAAPLQLSPEFHHRGDNGISSPVAGGRGRPEGLTTSMPRWDGPGAELQDEEERFSSGVDEEERAFQNDGDLDEEYEGEDYNDDDRSSQHHGSFANATGAHLASSSRATRQVR